MYWYLNASWEHATAISGTMNNKGDKHKQFHDSRYGYGRARTQGGVRRRDSRVASSFALAPDLESIYFTARAPRLSRRRSISEVHGWDLQAITKQASTRPLIGPTEAEGHTVSSRRVHRGLRAHGHLRLLTHRRAWLRRASSSSSVTATNAASAARVDASSPAARPTALRVWTGVAVAAVDGPVCCCAASAFEGERGVRAGEPAGGGGGGGGCCGGGAFSGSAESTELLARVARISGTRMPWLAASARKASTQPGAHTFSSGISTLLTSESALPSCLRPCRCRTSLTVHSRPRRNWPPQGPAQTVGTSTRPWPGSIGKHTGTCARTHAATMCVTTAFSSAAFSSDVAGFGAITATCAAHAGDHGRQGIAAGPQYEPVAATSSMGAAAPLCTARAKVWSVLSAQPASQRKWCARRQ